MGKFNEELLKNGFSLTENFLFVLYYFEKQN